MGGDTAQAEACCFSSASLTRWRWLTVPSWLADGEVTYAWLAIVIVSSIFVHVVVDALRSMFMRRRYPWDPRE
jgi:hypothetical protein